jgi:hypothetical protein
VQARRAKEKKVVVKAKAKEKEVIAKAVEKLGDPSSIDVPNE